MRSISLCLWSKVPQIKQFMTIATPLAVLLCKRQVTARVLTAIPCHISRLQDPYLSKIPWLCHFKLKLRWENPQICPLIQLVAIARLPLETVLAHINEGVCSANPHIDSQRSSRLWEKKAEFYSRFTSEYKTFKRKKMMVANWVMSQGWLKFISRWKGTKTQMQNSRHRSTESNLCHWCRISKVNSTL